MLVVPDFGRYAMAVERVERLLNSVCAALNAAGIEYAVVGGNAVAAWVASVDSGAVRATKDVDVLLRREDLGRAAEALQPTGLSRVDVLGVTMFVEASDPNPKTGVHVVIANEKVRPTYEAAAPDPAAAARSAAGVRVLKLPELVAMKLESFRRVDQVHVEDLLAVGLIDEALLSGLPRRLLERLEQVRDTER